MRSSAIRLSHSALPIHRSVLMHPTNQIGTITQRTQAQLGLTQFQTISRRHNSTHFLPTILQPAFWRNIIPKALRNRRPQPEEGAIPPPRAKDWNPATYFIVIFLLIGSQAIQTIALQNSFTHFSQQTEARLSLLRDVLKRVQAGENVDVEAELGTGDEVKEKQWADVMRELEEEDRMIQSRNQARRAKEAAAREAADLAAAPSSSPTSKR